MKNRWLALAVVLALALMPRFGSAQSSGTTQGSQPSKLRQNYPNPFNPQTYGAFTIGDAPACAEGNKVHRVSIRIFNILSQLVAVPVLQGSAGNVVGGVTPLVDVQLPCGEYTWFWNGNYKGTSQEAASGVYLVMLEVDGRRVDIKRMLNAK
jgi:hypothetical protein